MSERQLQFRVGLFVLLSLGAVTAMILKFSDVKQLWQETYTLAIHFDEASGLNKGAPVRLNGLSIGSVREVVLDEAEGGVLAIVNIQVSRKLRRDSRVSLARSLFGDATIEFTPGHDRETIPPNTRLHGTAPADPMAAVQKLEVNVTKTLAAFGETSEEWRLVARNVNSLMETHEGNLDDVIERAAVALDSFTNTMQKAQGTMSEANEALASARGALDSAQSILADPQLQADLKKTIAALPKVAEETRQTIAFAKSSVQKLSTNLDQLNAATSPLAKNSELMVEKFQGSLTQLESLLTELNTFSKMMNDDQGTLQKLAADPQLYENLNRSAAAMSILLTNLGPISEDVSVFADKVARHPELLGISGALSGSAGLKSTKQPQGQGVQPAAYEETEPRGIK